MVTTGSEFIRRASAQGWRMPTYSWLEGPSRTSASMPWAAMAARSRFLRSPLMRSKSTCMRGVKLARVCPSPCGRPEQAKPIETDEHGRPLVAGHSNGEREVTHQVPAHQHGDGEGRNDQVLCHQAPGPAGQTNHGRE